MLTQEIYSEANSYKNNPFKYIEIVGPIYATNDNYAKNISSIMENYLDWRGK